MAKIFRDLTQYGGDEREGKNKEAILLGTVKPPVSLSKYLFQNECIAFGKKYREMVISIIQEDYGTHHKVDEKSFNKAALKLYRKSVIESRDAFLDRIRPNQGKRHSKQDYLPKNPFNKFTARMLMDIENKLEASLESESEEISDLFQGSILNFYSSVDTRVDYATGTDGWIELLVKEENGAVKIVAECFIDVTFNEDKLKKWESGSRDKNKLTEVMFGFDPELVREIEIGDGDDEEIKNKKRFDNVDNAIFDTPQYAKLIDQLTSQLKNKLKIFVLNKKRKNNKL